MWKTFFVTGNDATPDGATDDKYGLDDLIGLANRTDCAELHDLADELAVLEQHYMARLDAQDATRTSTANAYAVPMMLDDPSPYTEVTMEDIETALRRA